MKTTISQALKEKNKLAAKLQRNWDRFMRNNSIIDGETRTYDAGTLMTDIQLVMKELVELKTRIHIASNPVRDKIFRLSELKNYVAKLKIVDARSGLVKERYDSQLIQKEAFYKADEIDFLAEEAEEEIEKIQEFLDNYNHQTSI